MKPILFNTDMVRAILDGRKTCTRRVVKPQPTNTDYCQHDMVTFDRMLPDYYRGDYSCACRKCGYGVMPNGKSAFQPPYKPGDILYVRETWCSAYDRERYFYRADKHTNREEKQLLSYDDVKWRPSIHMPREAARIFLRVTDVRVERLQEIDAAGIRAEGMDTMAAFVGDMEIARAEFRNLWNSTIKPADLETYGWGANPWV